MGASSETGGAAIEVRDLVKRYGRAPGNAVDGVSFDVRRGEIFGLLGPNGAGKTTTIGVLTAFARPTSGSARVMGIDVTADPMSVKQHIAVVPQQSNLDRSLRVREILTFHGAYHGVPRRERKARANALLSELGLADRAKDVVGRYSGGMAQRLMIARALMHAPDVLFLDEPTNNLDPQSRLFLWDRIRALNAQGLTILLTTHDMEEADQLCERIAIMDYGKILVNDTAAELKKRVPGGNALEVRVYLPELATVGGAPERGGAGAEAKTRVLDALRGLSGVTAVDELASQAAAAMPPGGGGGAPGGGARGGGGPGGPWAAMSGAGGPSSDQPSEPGIATFRMYTQDPTGLLASATQAVLGAGAELRDLHLTRPSLEDVFIHLTGRQLR
ncbi:MAG: ABC transporter ATP-binding protein [Ktedonobacterales bacterium]|nr:ABC transporter ATP-binding protein [Ktedonobacterales bacterium]